MKYLLTCMGIAVVMNLLVLWAMIELGIPVHARIPITALTGIVFGLFFGMIGARLEH